MVLAGPGPAGVGRPRALVWAVPGPLVRARPGTALPSLQAACRVPLMSASPVDEHLARFAGAQRAALEATRDVIRAALPGAIETISYGMPTFKVQGVAVVGFDGFTHHNSLFPYSGSVIEAVRAELPGAVTSKGTIQFDRDRPFPAPLLRRVLRARIEEINASYPKASGEAKEFYSNGRLKSSGRMRDGVMHGRWTFYRKDGTPMRSGSFDRGTRVGTWTTYDRAGAVHTETTF